MDNPNYAESVLGYNIRNDANFFSRWFFTYLNPTFSKGAKEPIDETDLPLPEAENLTKNNMSRIEEEWEKEKKKSKPSLFSAFFRANKSCLPRVFIFSLFGFGLKTFMPFVLSELIDWFSDQSTDVGYAYMLAGIYGICSLGASWIIAPLMYWNMTDGHNFRTQLCALLYKKCLNLNAEGRRSITIGKIVNIMSVDVNRCDRILLPFSQISVSPILLAIAIWQIYERMGNAIWGALGTTIFFLLLNIGQGKVIGTYRAIIAKKTDRRVRLLEELISSMRIIKMYVWEGFFLQKLMRFRKEEIKKHRQKLYFYGFFDSILRSSSKYLIAITISIYFSSYQISDFKASDLFAVSMFLKIIEDNLRFIFMFAMLFAELLNACSRIEDVLLLPEDSDTKKSVNPELENKAFNKPENTSSPTEYKVKNLSARYPGSPENSLDNITAKIPAGKLTGVIGSVGCGKSTLLSLLLNELEIESGSFDGFKSFGYASQEAWIITGTIKENILMGRKLDQKKYDAVVQAASLKPDFKLLEYGDETLIGDRGVTLSGGQKARVGLARAIYSDAEVYLLDDPLAAVDSKVASRLYDTCINGYLADKTRILVTHQTKYLTNASNIILMEKGQIVKEGTYKDIRSHLNDEEAADDDEQESETKKNEKKGERKETDTGEKVQEKNQETKMDGGIGFKNFWNYIKASDTLFMFFIWVILKLGSVSLFVLSDLQYSKIGDVVEGKKNDCNLGKTWNATGYGTRSICDDGMNIIDDDDILDNFNIYIILVLAHGVILALAYFTNYYVLCNSGQNIHDMSVSGVIQSPIRFFDTNPAGRILNRFSKDMGQMDELLPVALEDAITLFLRALGVMIINSVANWFSVLIAIPTILVFIWLRQYYLKTAREVKRLDGIMRSPMYNHVTNTIQGYLSIKAYGLQDNMYHHFNELQDVHGSAWILFCGTSRWLSIRLDTIISFYIAVVAIMMVPLSQDEELSAMLNLTPSSIGLSLSQAATMLGSIQWAVRQSSEAENYLTSVERIFEYAAMKPEPEIASDSDSDAPSNGKMNEKSDKSDENTLKFDFDRKHIKARTATIINRSNVPYQNFAQTNVVADNFYFKYSSNTAVVLKNVNFDIKIGEKIGIVGRTGAGKSSLISALFRMKNAYSGSIKFDGKNIGDIPLSQLRSSISIIPQEPIIFSETVRKNLDPTGKYSDENLWSVLQKVQLKNFISEKSEKLDFQLAEQGANLSVGQKQLMCLGRAILKNNSILLVDEATANVDPTTDDVIQKTINTEFEKCTVLTIAHRLKTIINSDRIMVLDSGCIVEFDHASKLLQKDDSVFKGMVDESKDRVQLYNTINKLDVNREKPEVNQEKPDVNQEKPEVNQEKPEVNKNTNELKRTAF